MDVVVVGGANFDFLVRGDALPAPGQTVVGAEFLQAPGGKGANQAVAAARLGARAAFVGRVGADICGEQLLASLQKNQVNLEGVRHDRRAATGVALITM